MQTEPQLEGSVTDGEGGTFVVALPPGRGSGLGRGGFSAAGSEWNYFDPAAATSTISFGSSTLM
jgi:hypothetical protein